MRGWSIETVYSCVTCLGIQVSRPIILPHDNHNDKDNDINNDIYSEQGEREGR